MGYKINKIILQNFKVFDEDKNTNQAYEKNITQELQILTGQNGYGKSSIYDAIELVLTGNIERIKKVSGNTRTFKDNLLTNNNTKDLIVGLELYNCKENKYLSILKHITKENIKGEKETNIDKWFDTYIYKKQFKLDDILNENNKLETENSIKVIEEHLKINPEYYYINYIQQQEPINFLKTSEEKRKEVVDTLLNIDKIKKEKKYDLILSKNEAYKKEYDKVKDEIKKKILERDRSIKEELKEKPNYNRLFTWSNDIEWDEELQRINNKLYEEDLDIIKKLVENHQVYENILNKYKLLKFKNKDIIEDIIFYLKYKERIISIKEYGEEYNKIKELLESIEKENRNFINDSRYIEYTGEELVGKIRQLYNGIDELKNKSNIILLEVNKNRENIMKILKDDNSLEKSKLSSKECPLCGKEYEDRNKLVDAIDSYTSIISTLLGEIDKQIEDKTKKLVEEKNKIKIVLNTRLLKYDIDEVKDENLYGKIVNIESKIKNIKYKVEQLKELNFDINNIYLKLENNNISLINIRDEIYKIIEYEIDKLTTEKTIELEEEKKNLDMVFKSYFKEEIKNISKISIEDIENKRIYLEYCYNYFKIEENNKLKKEIDDLKEKMVRLKYKIDRFKEIIKSFDKCIEEYKSKIIAKIEIPLYIYTGKILQNHPLGLGVFCYWGPESSSKISRLKFIGSMNTSHDVINIFSSGQLAGFMIGFTLAMNKVYNNNLDVILIDDPVQTMDELNLICFTEILRNEFCNKQVIMSTHERNIAGYINYKYKKYNLDSSIIDVREDFN